MKLFAPKYYKEFKCIADKCTHSCCVGWEIDVDPYTLEKYSSLGRGYGDNVKKSIVGDEPHFCLGENERCPHLDKKGLCRIITELGEDYLCDICREHPRFYNETVQGKEVGLGMACEEACRIILSSDDYQSMVELGYLDGEKTDIELDTISFRQEVYSVLSNRAIPYSERLEKIYAQYSVSPKSFNDKEWHSTIGELEYLDPTHKELFLGYSSDINAPQEQEKYLERALAYFVYRHCAEAYDYEELCARLGFCLFCERLLASLASTTDSDIFLLARIISEELEYSTDNTENIICKFLD
jgi:lysine-N-methylase